MFNINKDLYVYTGSEIEDYPMLKYGDILQSTISDFVIHVDSSTHIPVINITDVIACIKQDLMSLANKLSISVQAFNDAITALNIHKAIGLPPNNCYIAIRHITLGSITIPLGSVISNVVYDSYNNHIIKSFTYNDIVVDYDNLTSHLFRIAVNVNEFDKKYAYYMDLLNRDRDRFNVIHSLLAHMD